MSREISKSEAEYLFLEHMASILQYWINTECKKHIDFEEDQIAYRLSGLMHSVLTTLDGNGSLPGYKLMPDPHKEDQEFFVKNECDYYPFPPKYDIAGQLSCQIHKHIRKEIKRPEVRTFSQMIDKQSSRLYINTSEPPPEPLTYMVDKKLDPDLLTSLQERFEFPILNEEPISPKELVNTFLKIHEYWFSYNNSLVDKKNEIFAVCFAWANCHLDITNKDPNLNYALQKFKEEYLSWFKQKTPKTIGDILKGK